MDNCEAKLIITLIGKVNSGKSTLFCRLLDKPLDLTEISPVAGWTQEITLKPIFKNDILLADTPGLEDVESEVARKSFDFIGDTDVFLHIISAAEGVTDSIRKCSQNLFETQKPIITIINKQDTLWDQEALDLFSSDINDKLEHMAETKMFVFVAARENRGIDKLKDLLWNVIQEHEKKLRFAQFFQKYPNIAEWLRKEAQLLVKCAATRVFFVPWVKESQNTKYMVDKIIDLYGINASAEEILQRIPKPGIWKKYLSQAFGFLSSAEMGAAIRTTAKGNIVIDLICNEMKLSVEEIRSRYYSYYLKVDEKELEKMKESGLYLEYCENTNEQ